MKLSFLDPLYARPGPYASVWLDTSRDAKEPDRAIALRWRHLRDDLVAQGADTPTVDAVAKAVGTDVDVPGRHGQALFAARGQLLLRDELPQPPARDTARFQPLPEPMPLIFQHAPDIGYAAVDVRHTDGREAGAVRDELDVDLQTGRWPVGTVAQGPSTRRRVPTDAWREGAAHVVEDLLGLAPEGGLDVVVVRGGVWERGVLIERMPAALRRRVVKVTRDHEWAAEPGRALLEEELGEVCRGRMSSRDVALTERFLAQRARDPIGSEGITAVVEALRRARAEALLVNPDADLSVPVWVGDEPTHIALSAGELRLSGAGGLQETRAGAALLRALVSTAGELVVVEKEKATLAGGLGVLLRYTERPAAP